MGLPPQREIGYPQAHRSLYRHHEAVRKLLGVRVFAGPRARADAARVAREVCRVVNTRADIINIVIAELVRLDYELPTFGALLKIAEKEHGAAEQALYTGVEQRLTLDQRRWLDDLLVSELPSRQTRYNDPKRSAKRSSRGHLGPVARTVALARIAARQ